MTSIIDSNSDPLYTNLLRKWFVEEWGEIAPFEGTGNGVEVPRPLLLIKNEKLIGGLAFTSAVKPNSDEFGVWINALLVLPEYRRQGLASELVKKANFQAQDINVSEMYVYTDIPVLYQNQGWEIVDDSKESTVLRKYMRQSEV